jgi:hypothetical protein
MNILLVWVHIVSELGVLVGSFFFYFVALHTKLLFPFTPEHLPVLEHLPILFHLCALLLKSSRSELKKFVEVVLVGVLG